MSGIRQPNQGKISDQYSKLDRETQKNQEKLGKTRRNLIEDGRMFNGTGETREIVCNQVKTRIDTGRWRPKWRREKRTDETTRPTLSIRTVHDATSMFRCSSLAGRRWRPSAAMTDAVLLGSNEKKTNVRTKTPSNPMLMV